MSDPTGHIVKSFEQELHRLRDLLTEMGGIVESQVALATKALVSHDNEIAARVVAEDPSIDRLEREVEGFVIRMLALRQPMANDLRQIVAALKITGDLERIGDYAANVAKRSIVLSQFSLPYSMTGIANYGQAGAGKSEKPSLMRSAPMTLIRRLRFGRSDEAIDDVYNAIFRELITYMMEDPRDITPCAHLLFIAKNLERIGDHATNIAETVHYAVTGETLPQMRPKGDTSSYAVVRPASDT